MIFDVRGSPCNKLITRYYLIYLKIHFNRESGARLKRRMLNKIQPTANYVTQKRSKFKQLWKVSELINIHLRSTFNTCLWWSALADAFRFYSEKHLNHEHFRIELSVFIETRDLQHQS